MVHEEDEITSTILGPLDFLRPSEVHRFWQRVLESAGHNSFLPTDIPANVRTVLWDRRIAEDRGKPIEPDVVCTLNWDDGRKCIILIELKWRAPLSGKDQLHRQWKYYLTNEERTQAHHLFIAPEISAGVAALNNEEAGGDVWQTSNGNCLVLIPWLKFRAIFSDFMNEESPLGRWATLADRFLERIQIRKFSGFHYIINDISLPSQLPNTLFWNP